MITCVQSTISWSLDLSYTSVTCLYVFNMYVQINVSWYNQFIYYDVQTVSIRCNMHTLCCCLLMNAHHRLQVPLMVAARISQLQAIAQLCIGLEVFQRNSQQEVNDCLRLQGLMATGTRWQWANPYVNSRILAAVRRICWQLAACYGVQVLMMIKVHCYLLPLHINLGLLCHLIFGVGLWWPVLHQP